MAAHRYWALLLGPKDGNPVVGLADVEMRASAAGADQTSGGVAASTPGFAYGGSAANAFDNNIATGWYWGSNGTPGPPRLSYDFLSPVSVAEIQVTLTGAADTYPGSTQGPGGVWIQWSDNGTTWAFGGPVSDLSTLGNNAAYTISGVTDDPVSARLVGNGIRLPYNYPAGIPIHRMPGGVSRFDANDGGIYRIAGNVSIDGTPSVPVARRVRLIHRLTGRLVRETWSAADGSFAFEKIARDEYLVVSDDYTRLYNAVVADAVVSVP